LIEEVAVCAVNLNAIEARVLGVESRATEVFD
jgi:hypothetical protein